MKYCIQKKFIIQIKFIIIICIIFINQSVLAQDSTKVKEKSPKMYSIETIDGATITGTVISENEIQIILKTKSLGTVTILRKEIKEIKEITEGSFVNGQYWFENPNATRYIVGPSAFSLRKGEGYYQ